MVDGPTFGASEYIRGKRAFFKGELLPPMPESGRHSQSQCDFRSGWLVARSQSLRHPEWSPTFICS